MNSVDFVFILIIQLLFHLNLFIYESPFDNKFRSSSFYFFLTFLVLMKRKVLNIGTYLP